MRHYVHGLAMGYPHHQCQHVDVCWAFNFAVIAFIIYYRRVGKDTVYNQIIDDLNYGIKNLPPSWSPTEIARVTWNALLLWLKKLPYRRKDENQHLQKNVYRKYGEN
jgi:hypothetical protein